MAVLKPFGGCFGGVLLFLLYNILSTFAISSSSAKIRRKVLSRHHGGGKDISFHAAQVLLLVFRHEGELRHYGFQ